jgi:uncharacterized protein
VELQNPFITYGYAGPKYFCNREEETRKLVEAVSNGRHVTLISWRRMGKTGLIQHAFRKLKKQNCVYLDILHTNNLTEFSALLGKAILTQLESPVAKTIQQLATVFRRLRPVITVDPHSGHPSFELNLQTATDTENSLEDLFAYLKKRKQNTVIAIDEFQQIANYPEKKTEALLRSYIQHLPNVQFIFSGSQKHILSEMFGQASRPFYQSTQFMFLNPIKADQYSLFIQHLFLQYKKKIAPPVTTEILDWCMQHTFYVQWLCHKTFLKTGKEARFDEVRIAQEEILSENEPYYLAYKNLLTDQQWNLLAAIGKENHVEQINKKEFLTRYGLGASSVQRSIKALTERELVIEEETGFRIYDVFLSRWIQRNY